MLLEVLKMWLGFGMGAARGLRQIIEDPPVYKVGCAGFASQASRITAEAQGGYRRDHHRRYYPQVPLLRDQLFAALKGKEEHTLFKQPGKVPWAC